MNLYQRVTTPQKETPRDCMSVTLNHDYDVKHRNVRSTWIDRKLVVSSTSNSNDMIKGMNFFIVNDCENFCLDIITR